MNILDKYEQIYNEYAKFMNENSNYKPEDGKKLVIKNSTNYSSYFPIINFELANCLPTNEITNQREEYFDGYYFTINIYTKNLTTGTRVKVAKETIAKELANLTVEFFTKKNMLRTLFKPIPNLDDDIYRINIQYQCQIGNVRGNIYRK